MISRSFPDPSPRQNRPSCGIIYIPPTYKEDQFINKLKVPNPSITEKETRGQSNGTHYVSEASVQTKGLIYELHSSSLSSIYVLFFIYNYFDLYFFYN